MATLDEIEKLRFKAKRRGVRFSSRLSETAVADFEDSNGINLPSDYRLFLLEIGNGGDGPPAFGLCGLGAFPNDFDVASPDLAKPFPFTRPWVWETGEQSTEGGRRDVYCGIIILGTDGCGQYWALVVRGPDSGKIWMLADVGITHTNPKKTFVEWYEAWLDAKSE